MNFIDSFQEQSRMLLEMSKSSLFNLTKIYQQIDYNDSLIMEHHVTRGRFYWKDGIKDSEVIWTPDSRGRFKVSWTPKKGLNNAKYTKHGVFFPSNEHIGAFGCDSYDISGTVGGGGSNGALHGLTKYSMAEAPSNEFFLEYVARPQTAEIFFEEVLMACVFYGMPILVENNKPRLLYHFKNRGYRGFSMNRPDKHYTKLSKTEKELGGIPNTSEDIKQSHAAAIESHIEKYVGLDLDGGYRAGDQMGSMYFTRTLEDWARFDISAELSSMLVLASGFSYYGKPKTCISTAEKKSQK